MCGIAGAASERPEPRTGAVTLRLTRDLAHRGPDGEGFWSLNPGQSGLRSPEELASPCTVALGHRRLSIVDLEGGAQPMSDGDGRTWVCFNGEIYNHRELRAELERSGHRFRTSCDTEVLVHGWNEWGEDMFGRLNGIFAFALVDTRHGQVFLVRDPVGVKPLYVGVRDGVTWWSSELRAADDAGLVTRVPAAHALKLFLTFRFVPSPYTIYENVWKIPPGHFAVVKPADAGRPPAFRPYTCQIRSSASPRTQREWSEALFTELEAAVTRQLMADVSLSVLLSGGIDSSLVTRLMVKHLLSPPDTYGIGFGSELGLSEAASAETAALDLQVPHQSTLVSDEEYLQTWPAVVAELGEPIANTGAILVRMLCERVGRCHKVSLSGQGADEPLGGYPRHLVERVYRYARHAPRLSRAITQRAFGAENGRRLVRALAAADRVDRYVEIFSVTELAAVDRLVQGDAPPALELAREAVGRWCGPDQPVDSVNELLHVDARLSLADDLLIVGDLFAMRSGVELRVPFLDLQLLELLERMPSRYKISQLGQRKWLYRRGALERLPANLAARLGSHGRFARKRGFSTPAEWFSGDQWDQERDHWAEGLARLPLNRAELDGIADSSGPRQRALLTTLTLWAASPDRVVGEPLGASTR